MRLRSWLSQRLADRADLPTYLGGWLATIAWVWIVGRTTSEEPFALLQILLLTAGFVFSFWLRGCQDRRWWPLMRHLGLPLFALARLAVFVLAVALAVRQPLGGIGLLPTFDRMVEEWIIGALFVLATTLYSFSMLSDGLVAFTIVLGISMLGLMGTDNINPELGIAFLVFLLGTLLLLSNLSLTHYLGHQNGGGTGRGRGGAGARTVVSRPSAIPQLRGQPNGRQIARWLGDQFIVSGLTVALTAVVAIGLGALLQTISPTIRWRGMRMPGALSQRLPRVAGYASQGETIMVGSGGGLPPQIPLYRVESDSEQLWRRRTYDALNDRVWENDPGNPLMMDYTDPTSSWDGETRRLYSLDNMPPSSSLERNQQEAAGWAETTAVRQRVTALREGNVIGAALIVDLALDWPSRRGLPRLRYGDIGLDMPSGGTVEVISRVATPNPVRLAAAEWSDPNQFTTLLHVPTSAQAAITPFTAQVTAGTTTPYTAAQAILDWLESNIYYDAEISCPANEPSMVAWFLERKRGACDLIATTMVLAAREAGIPARLASGYGSGQRQEDGSYLVTMAESHAWAELYFEGLGWVTYNPAVAGSEDRQANAAFQELVRRVLNLSLPLLATLFLAIWLAWYVITELRRTRPVYAPTPAGRITRAYVDALRALARADRGRQPTETPREHYARLAAADYAAGYLRAFEPLVGAYERVRYDLGPSDEAAAAAGEAAVQKLKPLLDRQRRTDRQRSRR